jgi:dimethylargininase
MLIAITRQVSARMAECELTYLDRAPIDVSQAIAQHMEYERVLESLGATVVSLPALADQPDCVFVEDPAIVLDEVAVITRMGAEARRGESESLAEVLALYRPLVRMREPATLDGGDVVRMGKALFVGLSKRTNNEGVAQLRQMTEPFGYRVTGVPVTGCLHLKSACCAVSEDTVLANREWFAAEAFTKYRILDVAADEPNAADVLTIGGAVLIPATVPGTARVLEQAGFAPRAIDVSELQKAEAGVTCMSLVFQVAD